MSSGAPARSTSSNAVTAIVPWRALRVIVETCWMIGRTRIQGMGVLGYSLTWLTLPLFEMMTLALIYRHSPELQGYAVISSVGAAVLFALLFNSGEILDSERGRGTLGNLFLVPTPRFVWLAGFQLFALIEAVANATVAITAGTLIFDVELDVNLVTLVVTLALFTLALWGLSLILGSVGLMVRSANALSNILYPVLLPLSGVMYPLDRMPDWLRIPARCLPFGYGIEALNAALSRNASLGDVGGSLGRLALFAVALPLIGVCLFHSTDRAVRKIGSLDII